MVHKWPSACQYVKEEKKAFYLHLARGSRPIAAIPFC